MTEVFIVPVTQIQNPSDFAKRGAQKYKDQTAYNQSLTAWSLLEHLLERQGITPSADDIKTTENGKPYLTRGELHFNISHSADLVAVAISDKEVGIDIQKIEPRPNLPMTLKDFSAREADIKRRGVTITQIKYPPKLPVHQTKINHNNQEYYLSISSKDQPKITKKR